MAQSSSFSWNGRAWLAGTKRAARHGLELGLEHVLAEANKLVPLDEGTLERSGKVTMDSDPMLIRGAVSYDTPYAVRQHEEMSYQHLPGRQPKYLEQPANTEASTVTAIIAATVRSEAFLGGRLG